jgi:hypothetical protein
MHERVGRLIDRRRLGRAASSSMSPLQRQTLALPMTTSSALGGYVHGSQRALRWAKRGGLEQLALRLRGGESGRELMRWVLGVG